MAIMEPIPANELFRLLVEGTRDVAIFMLDPTGRVATVEREDEVARIRVKDNGRLGRVVAVEDARADRPWQEAGSRDHERADRGSRPGLLDC
ncbi:hypothetical protein AYO40_03200 [Planctomycetaceae bacterium SCGC AG-212-D15]|nr:hypothetical protein AYO40_03200 [Planctomycetaceae bacterium SCGC AG-212-D15]